MSGCVFFLETLESFFLHIDTISMPIKLDYYYYTTHNHNHNRTQHNLPTNTTKYLEDYGGVR